MNNFARNLLAAGLAASLPMIAQAVSVQVQVTGVVESSVIGGSMANVPDGAPVVMSFDVDSDNYLDSANFPTRGYVIDLASFDMTVGGMPVIMDNPQPGGTTAYFVLRNNDPAVDGFFISPGVEEFFPVSVHIPGLNPAHELDFRVTYGNTTTLSSLDILDAVGTYGFTGISVYGWTIGRFGNPGALYTYETLTISAVPEPASLSLLGLGLFAVLGRAAARRRASVG